MAEVVKLDPKPRVPFDARQGENGDGVVRAFPDRKREVENEKIELLRDWLEETNWLFELVFERAEEPFRDPDHLSEWVQLNWDGSETFSTAPLQGLRWQPANDMIFHAMEGEAYDFEALQPE